MNTGLNRFLNKEGKEIGASVVAQNMEKAYGHKECEKSIRFLRSSL